MLNRPGSAGIADLAKAPFDGRPPTCRSVRHGVCARDCRCYAELANLSGGMIPPFRADVDPACCAGVELRVWSRR